MKKRCMGVSGGMERGKRISLGGTVVLRCKSDGIRVSCINRHVMEIEDVEE